MKNKRGMLLASEVIKIVLSVMGLAILVFLLFAIYGANSKTKDLAKAKHIMEQISEKLDQIVIDVSYVGEIYQITPVGWSIFSFVQGEIMPNPCFGQNCICICDRKIEGYIIYGEDRQEKECSEEGVCLVVENLNKFSEILITKNSGKFVSLKIFEDKGVIEVKEI